MLDLLLTLAVLYVLLVAVVWIFQERLIFVGSGWGRGAVVPARPGVEVQRLPFSGDEAGEAADGGTAASVRVAVADAGEDARGAVVCFGGNGEDLRSGVYQVELWREYGYSAVYVEFPGYGDSDGDPRAETLRAAAEAGARFARQRLCGAGQPLIACANSMGSFCAVHLAAEQLVDRVVLRAPPSSILEAGRAQYPILPVALLLRHPLDNLEPASRATVPLLLLHGDRDRIVPQRLGRQLSEAWGGPSRFVSAEGFGHNDLPVQRRGPFGDLIAEFLGGDGD